MQKLISLFAEALEIMNIKAKLNVFLSFRNTILFSQQAIFVVYLTTETRALGIKVPLLRINTGTFYRFHRCVT
jgi:hypothetical protein